MENMSMQHFLWRAELKKARRHILAAPGDALITAACVCYHGPLDDKARQELITDWMERCRQGTFHMQVRVLLQGCDLCKSFILLLLISQSDFLP